MDFERLKELYLQRLRENPRAYEDISDILKEAEQIYATERLRARPGIDIGQSWRSWKGQNFEKLVNYIVSEMIEQELPLKVIQGSVLERRAPNKDLGTVKRNLLVDFGAQGCFVPDADIVVYSPDDLSVRAIISCKVTLRERIAQTGFWKLKLASDPNTEHIKVFFVTPDEDGALVSDKANKSKAIALSELDGNYVLHKGARAQADIDTLDKIIEELDDSAK